jgi:hypothetical protein
MGDVSPEPIRNSNGHRKILHGMNANSVIVPKNDQYTHITRQSVNGRSVDSFAYDQSFHPLDLVTKRSRYQTGRKRRYENDENEDPDARSSIALESEHGTTSGDTDEEIVHGQRGERQSSRIAAALSVAQKRPLYDMRKHPQDRKLRKLGVGKFGPRRTSSSKKSDTKGNVPNPSLQGMAITIPSSDDETKSDSGIEGATNDFQDGLASLPHSQIPAVRIRVKPTSLDKNIVKHINDLEDDDNEEDATPVREKQQVPAQMATPQSSSISTSSTNKGSGSNTLRSGQKPNFIRQPMKTSQKPQTKASSSSTKASSKMQRDPFSQETTLVGRMPASSAPSVGQSKAHLQSEISRRYPNNVFNNLSGSTPLMFADQEGNDDEIGNDPTMALDDEVSTEDDGTRRITMNKIDADTVEILDPPIWSKDQGTDPVESDSPATPVRTNESQEDETAIFTVMTMKGIEASIYAGLENFEMPDLDAQSLEEMFSFN